MPESFAEVDPPSNYINPDEALARVVRALEDLSENVEPLSEICETVDRVLTGWPDNMKFNGASFIREYKRVSEEMEAEAEADEQQAQEDED